MTEATSIFEKSDLDSDERWQNLMRAKARLLERIHQYRPASGVLLSGSSVYCTTPPIRSNSRFRDLDGIFVVPNRFEYANFTNELEGLGVHSTDLNSQAIYDYLRDRRATILRVSGFFEDTEVGFQVMTVDGLKEIASPTSLGRPYINVVPNEQRFTGKTITEKTAGTNSCLEYRVEATPESVDGRMLRRDFLSRRTASGEVTVGLLAEKLLISEVINDTDGGLLTKIRGVLWKNYLKCALSFAPEVTNEMLADGFSRSDRFSEDFRRSICDLLEKVRGSIYGK